MGYHGAATVVEGAHGEGKAAADHLVSFSLGLLEVSVPEIGASPSPTPSSSVGWA